MAVQRILASENIVLLWFKKISFSFQNRLLSTSNILLIKNRSLKEFIKVQSKWFPIPERLS